MVPSTSQPTGAVGAPTPGSVDDGAGRAAPSGQAAKAACLLDEHRIGARVPVDTARLSLVGPPPPLTPHGQTTAVPVADDHLHPSRVPITGNPVSGVGGTCCRRTPEVAAAAEGTEVAVTMTTAATGTRARALAHAGGPATATAGPRGPG